MAVSWESGIADLLSELSSIQDEVLDLLTAKRKLLMVSDTAGLASFRAARASRDRALAVVPRPPARLASTGCLRRTPCQ
jgi:hypothetical protein